MSVRAIERVFALSRTKGGARLVLLALASHADDQMEAWPSIETLRLKAALDHARSVTRILRELEAMGEIERVGYSRGGVVRYRIKLSDLTVEETTDCHLPLTCVSPDPQVTPDPQVIHTPDPQVIPTPDPQVIRGGASPDPQVTAPLTPRSSKPSLNKETVSSRANAKTPVDDWRPDDAGLKFAADALAALAGETGLPVPSVDSEVEKFRDHHQALGNRFADWGAAWRQWVRRIRPDDVRQRTSRPVQPPSPGRKPQARDTIPQVLL